MALIYTTIQHAFRKKHGLTINQYTLADMVYHLSNNAASDVPGWCYMSKVEMASELDFSKPTVINLTKIMIEKGFIIKHPVTKHLKTSKKWQNVYFTDGKESLPTVNNVGDDGKESLPDDGKESLPNNNNIYNNIHNILLSKIKISDVPQELEFCYKVALKFQDLIKKNLIARNSPVGKVEDAKFKNWVQPVQMMMKYDQVSREMLLSVYDYLKGPDSTFWKPTILSTSSLRNNITQMLAQANNKPEPSGTVSNGNVTQKLKAHD